MDPKAEPVGTCGKIWGMMGIMLELYVDSMGVLWGPNKESILMRFQRMALRISCHQNFQGFLKKSLQGHLQLTQPDPVQVVEDDGVQQGVNPVS